MNSITKNSLLVLILFHLTATASLPAADNNDIGKQFISFVDTSINNPLARIPFMIGSLSSIIAAGSLKFTLLGGLLHVIGLKNNFLWKLGAPATVLATGTALTAFSLAVIPGLYAVESIGGVAVCSATALAGLVIMKKGYKKLQKALDSWEEAPEETIEKSAAHDTEDVLQA